MTDAAYTKICALYEKFLQNKSATVESYRQACDSYWQLRETLPQAQWQTVNDCFCSLHNFYMEILAISIEEKS